jgi:hypothetical protein
MVATKAKAVPPKAPPPIDWVQVITTAFVQTASLMFLQAVAAKYPRRAAAPGNAQAPHHHSPPKKTSPFSSPTQEKREEVPVIDIDWEALDAAMALGVRMDSSEDVIRAALRSRLASSKIHPDQGGDGEEAKRLIAAKNLLIEKKRAVRR